MKPLKLRFAGIGSYPGLVEIDFDDLNPKGLYLIVGPTGAGKTTLLDAMTFALYGKVPSDRENAIVSLHSHRDDPFIEFEFSHADRHYLVHREPALPNKQTAPSKQWIRILDAAGAEISTITSSKRVTEECTAVIGLSADEFNQVILLPQGKFQRFLMAKGSEKQIVLQTIFGTYVYRRFVEKLVFAAKALEADLATKRLVVENQQAVISSNVQAIAPLEIVKNLEGIKHDPPSLIAELKNQASRLGSIADTALKAFGKKQRAKEAADRDVRRFDDTQTLKELLTLQAKTQAPVDAAKLALSASQRAKPVSEAVIARNQLVADFDAQTAQVSQLRKSIHQVAQSFKVSPELIEPFTTAITTASPSILAKQFEKISVSLESASEEFEEIETLEAQLKEDSESLKSDTAELAKAEKEARAIQTLVTKTTERLKSAREKSKGLPAAQKAVEEFESLLEKADIESAQLGLLELSEALGKAQAKFDKAQKEFRKAQDARSKELAGFLAESLEDGEPCPVCGSPDHPSKAKISGGSDIDLEKLELTRNEAQKALTNAERDVKDAQKAVTDAEKFVAELPSKSQQELLYKNLEKLTAFNDAVDELADELETHQENLSVAKEDISEIKSRIKLLTESETRTTKRLAQLEASTKLVGSKAAVSKARERIDEVSDLLLNLADSSTILDSLEGGRKQAVKVVEAELKKSQFATEALAVAATLDTNKEDELTELVNKFAERETRILKIEAAIGLEPVPLTRPDLATIDEDLRESEELAEETSKAANAVSGALEQIESAYQVITDSAPMIKELQAQAIKASSMATVFEKGATGQLGLEVWVQRTLFEEVCLVANGQLGALSSNRYSLTLDQEEGGISKRRGSGLDIYVLDSHTGKTRPVQTMSGGEQFMASLALALALAEVVQRHSGGIELPCLFIDEGFGGLDGEALDLAIDLLGKLHASGRTVGIITHVEAMQEQLPIGIRVTKTDRGSSLEVLSN